MKNEMYIILKNEVVSITFDMTSFFLIYLITYIDSESIGTDIYCKFT